MKATEEQKLMCKVIVDSAKWWVESSNIDSYSHYDDIKAMIEFHGVFEFLEHDKLDKFVLKIYKLYNFIKKLETNENRN